MLQEEGFTLIELIIVMAIIGVLSAIALPVYSQRASESANSACVAELKGYTNSVLAALANNSTLSAPQNSACQNTTNATTFTAPAQITANPRNPGTGLVTCTSNGNCTHA